MRVLALAVGAAVVTAPHHAVADGEEVAAAAGSPPLLLLLEIRLDGAGLVVSLDLSRVSRHDGFPFERCKNAYPHGLRSGVNFRVNPAKLLD